MSRTLNRRTHWWVGLGAVAAGSICLAAFVLVQRPWETPDPVGSGATSATACAGGAAECDSPTKFKAHGAFARDGDGTVRFIGGQPQRIKIGQTLTLKLTVTNVSDSHANYTVTLKSNPQPFDRRTAQIAVDGNSSADVSIPIDTAGLHPGQYRIEANLTSNLLNVDPLSSDSVVFEVQ